MDSRWPQSLGSSSHPEIEFISPPLGHPGWPCVAAHLQDGPRDPPFLVLHVLP